MLGDMHSVAGQSDVRRYTGQTGSIRDIILKIGRDLAKDLPDQPGLCGDAELVIAEALNNIEEHGYRAKPGHPLRVEVLARGEDIKIRMTDFGCPMPGLNVPAMRHPQVSSDVASLPEGGFGWYLIHSLAPQPVYERRGNRNVLTLSLKAST